MLPESTQRLLTAAIDRELSPGDKRVVQRLLQESQEARRFYRRLKRDSRALKALPRKELPLHFSVQVLQAIGETARVAPSSSEPAAKRWLPVWANVAAAAAVMFAVCIGTYMVIALNDQERTKQQANQRTSPSPDTTQRTQPELPIPPVANNVEAGKGADDDLPEKLTTPPLALNEKPKVESPKPQDKGPGDVLTGPALPKMDLSTVSPLTLPPVLAVRDLDQDAGKQRLAEMLKKGESISLDLFCKDTNKGFERIQSALRARGERLLIDPVAQARYGQKLKTHYVVYAEGMTAHDINRLFQLLAADERQAESKKDGQFDKLVVKPLSVDSQKLLVQLLGAEPKWLQKTKAGDSGKSLQDSTADKLATRPGEKGSFTPFPIRGQEPTVLILSPIRPAGTVAKESRQYLDHRRDPRRDAIPLMLVLRTAD